MDIKKLVREKPNLVAFVIPVVIILIPIVYSVGSLVFAGGANGPDPFIEMPDPKYTECVRETAYMRFHHWELLAEIRDDVVREGIRGDISLDNCRECHSNRERFCNRCHDAVNLTPDCWGCHYYPATPEATTEDPHARVIDPKPHHMTTSPDEAPEG